MKILHLVETLDPSGGGVPSAVKSLVAEQERQGHQVSVVVIRTDRNLCESKNNCIKNSFSLYTFGSKSKFKFLMHNTLWREVFNSLKPDICHLHCIWTPSFFIASRVLKDLNIPVILSPHGKIMPSLLKSDYLSKRLKKLIYFKIFAVNIFKNASLIHAVSQAEADVLSEIVKPEKIQVIYNFIEEEFFGSNILFSEGNQDKKYDNKKIITFIGRIERRKGIVNLVEAFCTTKLSAKWKLRIVGPIYEKELVEWIKNRVKSSESNKEVIIMEPIYGHERLKVYQDSFAVCLPSYSEVVGLVNIETALMGRLVITTPYAGINEIAEHGGIVCNNDVLTLRNIFNGLEYLSENDYQNKCQSLHKWANKNFSREILSKKWETAVNNIRID